MLTAFFNSTLLFEKQKPITIVDFHVQICIILLMNQNLLLHFFLII